MCFTIDFDGDHDDDDMWYYLVYIHDTYNIALHGTMIILTSDMKLYIH